MATGPLGGFRAIGLPGLAALLTGVGHLPLLVLIAATLLAATA